MIKKAQLNWVAVLLLFGFNNLIWAQHTPTALDKTPEWAVSLDKKEAKVGDIIEVTFTSVIEKDWYMYSNDFDPNLGPIAAEFTFEKNASYKLIGKATPIGSKKHYEEIWKGDVSIFKKKAVFKQKIQVLKTKPVIKGSIYFQECNEISGVCMPPFDVPFDVKVNVLETEESNTMASVDVAIDSTPAVPEKSAAPAVTPKDTVQQEVESDDLEGRIKKSSLWGLFLLAFGFGIGAIGTPCVYPMIPMTVSFFTKKSQTRLGGVFKGLIFGLSIIFIYTVVGVIVASIFGEEAGYIISTHWLPNILFFVIFIVFGAAFLGMFELTLPSSFVNKIDSKSSMNGFSGIFFMAFTLTLVSFSCTGPIAGAVLGQAVNGQFLRPVVAMFGFSLAFALPFTLFAIFPSWLQNMPKSGGWLNSVKVVLGFIEVGFAFKFLSNADVVYHWRLLDREIYLAIWIVLSILLGLYLLGKIKFSHDSDVPYVSVPRFFLALIPFIFAVYMIPGLFGAPLKALSGLLPPMHTQDFKLGQTTETANQHQINTKIKHSDFLHLPHGITGYYDYKQALEESKKQNKPIFIDFTGHSCVNCRKMEEYVWAKPEVLKRLKEDFIVVSLYVDERKVLPESEWYISKRDGKVKKAIGEQNQDLQISKYNFNAQPQYVIIDGNENRLSGPKFFDTEEQTFIDFLDAGKNNFKQQTNP